MAVKTQLFSALLQTLSATDTLIPAPRSTHYRCKFTYANVSENFPTNTTLRRKAPSPHPTPPTAHPNNPEINLSRDAQKGLLYLLWHATCQSNQNINNKKWVNITNTLGLKKNRVGPSYGESIHGPKRIIRQRFGSGWGRGLPYGACACFSGFYGSHRSSVRRRRRTC